MNLYLSRWTYLNSVYMHDSGQVLYKVVTPMTMGGRISTVYKVVPSDANPLRFTNFDPSDDHEAEDDPSFPDLTDETLKDQFSVVGSVAHKALGNSILTFGDKVVEANEFFTKDGRGLHGFHRKFTGPDGRGYKWHIRALYNELCLDDERQTRVARFYPKSHGIFGRKHPAYLEISEEGLQILDYVLITFIYAKKRREQN